VKALNAVGRGDGPVAVRFFLDAVEVGQQLSPFHEQFTPQRLDLVVGEARVRTAPSALAVGTF